MHSLRPLGITHSPVTSTASRSAARWLLLLAIAATVFAAPCWPQTGTQSPPPEEETDLVILLDRSGSMRKTDQRGLSRALALYLVDQTELAGEANRVAVVPFATEVSPLTAGLTTGFGSLRVGLQQLAAPSGQTDIEMALRSAARLLAPLDEGRRKQVIMLTDGMPEPNPADTDRFPEIAEQFRRKVASVSPASREYRQILEDYSKQAVDQTIKNIENVVLPALEGKVEIYPIGLHSTDTGRDFLEKLAVRTTRMAESLTLVSNANELVLAAHRLVHRGSQTVPIVQERLDAPGTEYQKEVDFGPYFSKARVVINYLEEGVSAEDLDIALKGPDGETYGRESKEYLSSRDRDGSGGLVFERFMLDHLGQGRWRIELKSRRQTKRLPAFELLVEGRSNLRLLVEANPHEAQVPGSVEIRAALSSADGHPVAIAKAAGEVRDRQGNAIPVTFVTESGGIAVGRVDLPEQPVGDYLVTARASVTEDGGFAVGGRASFLAVPQEAVELLLLIPYGGADPSGGDSLKADRLSFPPVGDQALAAGIRAITVENASTRSAPVSIELISLANNTSGELLDATSWLKVKPPRGTAIKNRPFRFDVALEVPKRLPSSLRNGLYSGVLRVHSPDAPGSIEVPVEVTLAVPDIQIADPKVADQGLDLSLWWRRPGSAGTTLRLGTNSAVAQKAAVRLISHLTDSEGGAVDAARLHLAGGEGFSEQIEIAPDATVQVPVLAVAEIAGVAPGTYFGEVFIDAERARDLRVPVRIEVPPLQWISVARWVAAAAALMSLAIAAWFLWLRVRRRGLFRGDFWELQTRRDFRNGTYLFAADGRSLFTLSHDEAGDLDDPRYELTPAGGEAIAVTDGLQDLDAPYRLGEGYEIEGGGFRFRVQRISRNLVRSRVLDSRYSRHTAGTVIALIVALGFAALWSWWTFA